MGLRDILDAATPGPWAWNSGGYSDSGHPLMGLQNAENPTSYPVLDCAVLGDPEPADARLIALAPELAALVLDMGEFITEKFGVDGWLDDGSQALLARLDQLGKEQTDG